MSRKQSAVIASLGSLLCLVSVTSRALQSPLLADADTGRGKVHFETSCSPTVQRSFEYAVALLHSFEFGPAIAGFRRALAVDPRCAMAYWGIALGSWGNPFAPGLKPRAYLEQGQEAIDAANAAKPTTQRERDYIAAASRLYDGFETRTQKSRLDAYSV